MQSSCLAGAGKAGGEEEGTEGGREGGKGRPRGGEGVSYGDT